MSKNYNIVGVSTNGKSTKFRVANGDLAARVKVLTRNHHTDIVLVELPAPLGKVEAIDAFKAQHPQYANVRMPNEKPEGSEKKVVVKKTKAADPAVAVLKDAAADETVEG